MGYNVTPTTYMINQHTAPASDASDRGITNISLARIDSPSTTILGYDYYGNMDSGGWSIDGARVNDLVQLLNGTSASYETSYGTKVHRHLDGTNILWADGHVKWQKQVTEAEFTLNGND
jgi:prepilin-type processing-associated H-X9-DG protein